MATWNWDPGHYLDFADERGRPFFDLMGRVGVSAPARVVDLGCGPGNLTATLAERWPAAEVLGIDSSAEMIERARASSGRVAWAVADLRDWLAGAEPGSVDVLVSNATLQWVPDHLDLLGELLRVVRPGGALAFQVPRNFDEPSHALREELAAEPEYALHLEGVARPAAPSALTYLHTLQDLGADVDAWETTYLHVLTGPDPVYEWVTGTGARPTLAALPEPLRTRFAERFRAALAQAYPDTGRGVVLPFARAFVVASPGAGAGSGVS